MTKIEEQMNMFWLGAGEDMLLNEDYDPLVDAETGNFYFWLGPKGEETTATLVSRQDFEDMQATLNG